MPDYKSMYFELAARVADAVELLVNAQRKAEETYIDDDGANIIELNRGKDKYDTD